MLLDIKGRHLLLSGVVRWGFAIQDTLLRWLISRQGLGWQNYDSDFLDICNQCNAEVTKRFAQGVLNFQTSFYWAKTFSFLSFLCNSKRAFIFLDAQIILWRFCCWWYFCSHILHCFLSPLRNMTLYLMTKLIRLVLLFDVSSSTCWWDNFP